MQGADRPLELLRAAFRRAVEAAQPALHLQKHLPPLPAGRLVVVGAGKAASTMAQAVEAHYGELEGLVITRYGHKLPTKHIEVVEAAHPVPDRAGLEATERILDIVRNLSEHDTVICLISGGGSALLTAPEGLTLSQKAALTDDLLRCGATIHEINAVRKHLSNVKGGRLAQAAAPAQVYSFYLSDVVGDDLSSVASGPTSPDPSTFADALAVLDRYAIAHPAARQHFAKGLEGKAHETPKPNDSIFGRVSNTLIANNQKSLEAVADFFRLKGVPAHILSSSVEGEARDVAKVHAAIARQVKLYAQPFKAPCALISGGETTVTVRRAGAKGGRNSEFALSLALELGGLSGVYALAADTDGIDGSENNAGVFVTPGSLNSFDRNEAVKLLEANNSYEFFRAQNALLVTGATNTNVNDLRILVLL